MAQLIFKHPVMIFRRDYDGMVFYTYGQSKKKQDGSYENGYFDCQFKKGIELNNRTKIKINDAWDSFYINKDKRTVRYTFINDFDVLDDDSQEVNLDDILGESQTEEYEISDGDLPF